jgi:hypothetical protein
MDIKNFIIGFLLILYGTLKIAIGIISIFTSNNFKDKIRKINPHISSIISFDETFAAKMIEYILILFGVFSLLHGLDKFHLLSKNIHHKLHKRITIYIINAFIGLVLTIFYTLVVYTNLPIEKNIKEINRYKFIGIITGLSFLMMIPLYLIYHSLIDYGFNYLFTSKLCIFAIIILIILLYICLRIYASMKQNDKKNKIVAQDIISFAMIPLNTF